METSFVPFTPAGFEEEREIEFFHCICVLERLGLGVMKLRCQFLLNFWHLHANKADQHMSTKASDLSKQASIMGFVCNGPEKVVLEEGFRWNLGDGSSIDVLKQPWLMYAGIENL
ncbi:hypothetical protein JHK85_048419 [Glycine max]|nr:hypothetical protein JHK86_047802 [Glycine max]KAG4943773.1 hypothetical protein JHK85_048419 [Glycine max]